MQLKTNRSLLLLIVLSIITLGIYGFFFVYSVARDVNIACERDGKKTISGILLILLIIVLPGLFLLIWNILLITRLESFAMANNRKPDVTVLSFLLWLFVGSFIIIGPFVAYYKLLKGVNQVCAIYNETAKA